MAAAGINATHAMTRASCPVFPRVFVLALAIICAIAAAPAHARQLLPTAPPAVESTDSTHAPVPAPALDLKPRPLGTPAAAKKPANKPTTDSTAASPSAASTLLDNPIIRTALSLSVVVGLILLLAVGFRKLSARASGGLLGGMTSGGRSSAPAGILEILGRYPISRGQTLLLLKVDRRILLLSQTTPRIRAGAGTLTTLAEIADPEDVASILLKAQDADGASNSARFQSLLGRFDSAHLADTEPTTLSLRETRATTDGDHTEMWDTSEAAATFPLVPPLADARPAARHPAQQPAPTSDSFGSLRQRLSALNGEAHR